MMRTELLSVTSIMLDSVNPRLDLQQSQQQTLRAILKNQGEKLVTLAQDILDYGLNPAEVPIVVTSEEQPDRYVVIEGNRRVAALRLLASPDLAVELDILASSWVRMAAEFASSPIESILCAVVESRGEADHWVRLRHTGQNRGAGIVPWGATETARFEERRGKLRVELQVLDFVRADEDLPDEVREKLSQVAITNLERLLSDPDVRIRLGIERDNRQILTALPDSEVIKGLRRVVSDLALRKIKVGDIERKKERQEYLDSFSQRELPDLSMKTDTLVPLREAPKQTGVSRPRVRPTPGTRDRSELVPRRYVTSLEHGRINDVFLELKRLGPRKHPNACAVLLRVFLELAVDDYLARNANPSLAISENAKLAEKVQRVADHLKKLKILDDEQLKPIRRSVSSDNLLAASISTLHAYVHSVKLNPDPDSLKAAWDNLEEFLDAILPKRS